MILSSSGEDRQGLQPQSQQKEMEQTVFLILGKRQGAWRDLNQCIHKGFGLHTFQEELTGPEYSPAVY